MIDFPVEPITPDLGSRLRAKADTTADKMGIYPVTLDPGLAKFLDYIHSNEHWHMDGTTCDIPPRATNLKCEIPPCTVYTAGLQSVEARLPGGIEGYVNGTIPVKRVGQPEDIANAVAFLASEASGYITGLTLSVNGGRYMQ